MDTSELGRIIALEERILFIQQRIEGLEKNNTALNDLATTMKVLANDQKHVLIQVSDLNAKVDCLEKQPGNRWNSMVDKIISVLVGGIIGYLITMLV